MAVVRSAWTAGCLLLLAGCVTDEPAVYKDSVVTKEVAKPFLGVYQVKKWPGNMKPETVLVTQEDDKMSFAYSAGNKDLKLRFVLSKIPKSKKDLYLLAVPSQGDTNRANIFFVGRALEEETHLWVVVSNSPVAREHLQFTSGRAKAEDVKAFLAKHADEFASANEPQVQLENPSE